MPLCSWAEYAGDYVNLEGRVQTAQRAVKPKHESRPGYAIMEELAGKFEVELNESEQARQHEIDRLLELDTTFSWPSEYLKVGPAELQVSEEYPLPLFVCDDYHHRGHLTEKAESLTNFAPEAYVEMSPDMAAKFKLNTGDLVRIESEVGKVIVPTRISEHLRSDVLLVPRNFSTTPVTSLLMRKKRIDRVKLTRVDE